MPRTEFAFRIASLVVLFAAGACGSVPTIEHDAGTGEDSGIIPVDSGIADAGPVDAGPVDAGPVDAGPVDAGPPTPGIPVVTAATVVVHGTHQITWQLPASGCSTLSLMMKVGAAGTYSVVKMVTGVATSTQYGPGHALGTYCYEVVCILGGTTSSASNEKCATQ